MLNSKGVKVKRTAGGVLTKISNMEKAFKKAFDFADSETGAGVKEKDGQKLFDDVLLSKCLYHFDLLPIMKDRSAARPKCTNQ